jgi:hypothetical protein
MGTQISGICSARCEPSPAITMRTRVLRVESLNLAELLSLKYMGSIRVHRPRRGGWASKWRTEMELLCNRNIIG